MSHSVSLVAYLSTVDCPFGRSPRFFVGHFSFWFASIGNSVRWNYCLRGTPRLLSSVVQGKIFSWPRRSTVTKTWWAMALRPLCRIPPILFGGKCHDWNLSWLLYADENQKSRGWIAPASFIAVSRNNEQYWSIVLFPVRILRGVEPGINKRQCIRFLSREDQQLYQASPSVGAPNQK